MRKAAIYPFTLENSILATYKDMVQQYDIKRFITNSETENGIDAGCLRGNKSGVSVSSNIEEILDIVDSIILLDGLEQESIYLYKELAEVGLKRGKEVIACKSVYNRISSDVKGLQIFETLSKLNPEFNEVFIEEEILYDIPVPVVTVYGLDVETQKFDIQIQLRKKVLDSGYNLFQLGSNEKSVLFGYDQLPEILFSREVAFPEKAVILNRLLYSICQKKQIDVIVIGCPGEIVSYNNQFPGHMGELAAVISKAAPSDVSVLALHLNENINKEFLRELQMITKYKLGFEVEYFLMSNIKKVIDREARQVKFHLLLQESIESEISKVLKESGVNFGYINDDEKELESIIEQLRNNIEIL